MSAFDAIVIGAGQAGPFLGGRLTAAGMAVAVVERHLFGGTCVNPVACRRRRSSPARAGGVAVGHDCTDGPPTIIG
jgi:2-polyprenyl-6-methoxyphenol hydroxylase-like FAD-dependent oxidoreductase